MNVLAINGSPHMDDGNTALILNHFLEGIKEAGANVELFYTRKLKIGPCNGDMSCWFQNPGKCGQDDDMQMLLPKFKESDVIVWASPVYYSGITGPLKNLMDRQLPLFMQENAGSKTENRSCFHLRSKGIVHVWPSPGPDESSLLNTRSKLRVRWRSATANGRRHERDD